MLCILASQLEVNGDIKIFASGFTLKQSSLTWSALISLNEMEKFCRKVSEMKLGEEEQYELIKEFVLNW